MIEKVQLNTKLRDMRNRFGYTPLNEIERE